MSKTVLHPPIRWDLLAQDIAMVSQASVCPRCAGVEIEISQADLPHNGKVNNLRIASFVLSYYKFALTHDTAWLTNQRNIHLVCSIRWNAHWEFFCCLNNSL